MGCFFQLISFFFSTLTLGRILSISSFLGLELELG